MRFMDSEKEKDKEKEVPQIPSIELLRMELAREEYRHSFRKTLLNIAGVLAVVAAIVVLLATRLFMLIQVNGNSMNPTLGDGEIVILQQTKEVEKGDVAGFYYGGRVLLKRVVGGPEDYIDIDQDGNVSVNGKLIDEPYLTEKNLGKCELEFPYRVPKGMYFVLGDNRAISVDSRIASIGCVQSEQIVGKVVFRAWPLNRMGIMH